MININNRNAYAGRNVEFLFQNSIGDHPSIIANLRKSYGIEGEFETVIAGGIYGEKSDARIAFTSGHYLDVNIKAFKGQGFNQVTRTTISKFCRDFGLNNEDKNELEGIVVAKSRNTSQDLFPEQTRDKWGLFFHNNVNQILRWGFSYKPSRELLVLYSRDTDIMYLYRMKDVLSSLPKNITFTKGGFNIGSCISFQRKGGNGSMSKHIPKEDISHPGNNVQLKIKPHKFITEMSDILLDYYRI